MEYTGHYHEPILKILSDAGFFVSAVNPHLIKDYDGNNSLRKVKSDPANAKKIAGYTLDKWHLLHKYSAMDNTRSQLKTLNTQFQFLMRQKTSLKNNLISLLDLTYPGINALFDSPVRTDGSQKWLDYAYSFWHADCVKTIGLKAFSQHYKKFCKRQGYNFQPDKPELLFEASKELVVVAPKNNIYKEMILASIQQVNLVSAQNETMRLKMDELASTLPESKSL